MRMNPTRKVLITIVNMIVIMFLFSANKKIIELFSDFKN